MFRSRRLAYALPAGTTLDLLAGREVCKGQSWDVKGPALGTKTLGSFGRKGEGGGQLFVIRSYCSLRRFLPCQPTTILHSSTHVLSIESKTLTNRTLVEWPSTEAMVEKEVGFICFEDDERLKGIGRSSVDSLTASIRPAVMDIAQAHC